MLPGGRGDVFQDACLVNLRVQKVFDLELNWIEKENKSSHVVLRVGHLTVSINTMKPQTCPSSLIKTQIFITQSLIYE